MVITLIGYRGSGKTVVASSIARDADVGARFSTICFVGIGQDADLRELQRSLHIQLVQSVLDPSLREEEAFAALQAAHENSLEALIFFIGGALAAQFGAPSAAGRAAGSRLASLFLVLRAAFVLLYVVQGRNKLLGLLRSCAWAASLATCFRLLALALP